MIRIARFRQVPLKTLARLSPDWATSHHFHHQAAKAPNALKLVLIHPTTTYNQDVFGNGTQNVSLSGRSPTNPDYQTMGVCDRWPGFIITPSQRQGRQDAEDGSEERS